MLLNCFFTTSNIHHILILSLVPILTVKITIVIYLYYSYSIKEKSDLLWVIPKTNGAVDRS